MKFYEKSREFAQFYPQMEIIYKPLWTSDIHPLTPQSHLSQYDLSDDKRRGQPCVAVFILSGLISAQFTVRAAWTSLSAGYGHHTPPRQ